MTRGILGTTVHFGSRRVTEDGGRRVADADEDVVTLTVAALRGHLAKNGLDAQTIGELFLVGRFDDAATETVLAALGRGDLPVSVFADAPLAAVDALLVAHDRDATATTYVVAASDGRADDTLDRGAAAAVVAVGRDAEVRLLAQAHHRAAGTTGAARAAAIVEELGATEDAAYAPILQRPGDARAVVPRTRMERLLPMPVGEWGALGCAAPLVTLAWALDTRDAHELVWWGADVHGAAGARFSPGALPEGGGVADALATHAVPITLDVARRARVAWSGGGMTAQGAFVSMQSYLGQADARYRWVGQRCTSCDTVVFPPRESCPSCAASPLAPHPLSGRGTVYARTRIGTGGAPTEFAPLQDATGAYDVVIVELVEGPRVAAMCTASEARPAIGTPVRFELRLLYVQDRAARYGFKAVPALEP